MKKRKVFLMFFVLLLFTSQIVYAVDDRDKCLKYGGEIPYKMKSRVARGSHLGGLYFSDTFTQSLDFQEDSFELDLFADLNGKKIDLQTLIPEFKNFREIGNLKASEHSFSYKLTKDQLKLLNGLYNDSDILISYKAKLNKDAFTYIPEKGDCRVDFGGHNPREGSDLEYFESKRSKEITVIWDDDNDRDGIRTNQEVYYLKLDKANDDENGPLFKVLEIPSRGNNEESQVFGNVPDGWDVYDLDGKELDVYTKEITGNAEDGFTITYKHIPKKIDFNVNVVWRDENNKYGTRPNQVTFGVLKDTDAQLEGSSTPLIGISANSTSLQGTDDSKYVIENGAWSKSFQEYKFEEGQEIIYNLKFPNISKYKKDVNIEGNNYTVTYTSNIIEAEKIKPIAKRDVVATKTWVNGREEDHKEVKLELYRKTNLSEKELLNTAPEVKEENGKFIYTWKELPATNTKGEAYNYSVKEVEVPENYEVTYHGFDVINTYKSPTKDVEVKVKWVGGDPQDTKIILYRKDTNSNLEEVGVFDSNKDNLSKTFEKMPVTDGKGQDYTYYAYQPEVPEGFTVSYSDDKLTVINTKIPEVRPEPKPNPKPDTQVVEKTEEPTFKRHDYTPTYPVVTRVPEEESLKYIFTIDEDSYKEIRNGFTREFKMDVAPLIRNERTMLPLRYVGEALDAEVIWDKETRTATFIKNGRRAEIQIDNDQIVLSNGEIIKMDSKPLNINSRILVPLTNVANVFGLTNGNTEDHIKQDIEWDKETRTVTIYVR